VSLADGRIIAERSRGKFKITRMTSFGDTSTRVGRPRPVTFASGQTGSRTGGEGCWSRRWLLPAVGAAQWGRRVSGGGGSSSVIQRASCHRSRVDAVADRSM